MEGRNLSYYRAGESGPIIVLVHGNSQSALTFRHQLESGLAEKYRLFAIELPGHGLSSPATDPEGTYSLPGYAQVLAAFAKELGIEDGVFVGTSLGGHIVLEASLELKKASGFLINATPPVGKPPAMDKAFLTSLESAFKGELTNDEVMTFASLQLRPEEKDVPESIIEDIKKTDMMARQYIGSSIGGGVYADELEIVKNLTAPLAILHGEEDQLINDSYFGTINIPTLWRSKVHFIKNASHCPQWENPEEYNRLLGEFVEEVTD